LVTATHSWAIGLRELIPVKGELKNLPGIGSKGQENHALNGLKLRPIRYCQRSGNFRATVARKYRIAFDYIYRGECFKPLSALIFLTL